MRPPAKVQECQNCRSKNVQDWRGGQYLCKRCLRHEDQQSSRLRESVGSELLPNRRVDTAPAPRVPTHPPAYPISVDDWKARWIECQRSPQPWNYHIPPPDNHPLGSINMTIFPDPPTLYLNFPEKKSWADIMEEEDQQVYYQGWIKTEN